LQSWKKAEGIVCLPLATLFKEFLMDKVHLQGKSIADFGMVPVGKLAFSPYSSGIISKARIEAGGTI
jgi:hypothetical protein